MSERVCGEWWQEGGGWGVSLAVVGEREMKRGKPGRGMQVDNPLADRNIMDVDESTDNGTEDEEGEEGEESEETGAQLVEPTANGSDKVRVKAEPGVIPVEKEEPPRKQKKAKKTKPLPKNESEPSKEEQAKQGADVAFTFLGVPLFTPQLLRVYFTLVLLVNMLFIAFMWFIQLELNAGDSYTAALVFGGILVGLQMSNFGMHWKAGRKAEAKWMTAKTVRGHVLRWERQKWHTKMIFYPIMVLIVLTVIYNFGVYTLVIYYTGETGKCPTGVLDGVSMFDDEGNGKLLLGGFSVMFVAMLLLMSLLSVTHFKQYMSLHQFRLANPVEEEAGGEDESDKVGLNSGLFRASFIRRTYVLSIVAQGMILVALSLGKEATQEPNLLYSLLMFGIFLLGWQVGVGERHLHFDASVEPSSEDVSLVRDRIEWHGSMMFYPCAVSIAQCFYNFSALFTLLPYFATSCESQTIGAVMSSLNSTGWVMFASNSMLFGTAISSLIFLCLLHFVQFQRYQMIAGT